MSDRFYPLSFPAFYFTGDIYIINWVLLGHLVIAYFTAFLLFSLVRREYNVPSFIVPFFSLLYITSGAVLARVMAGQIFIVYALSWIPLLYYAYFRIVRYSERTLMNILIFVIASLFILFSASVYYLFFSYLFIVIMLGYEFFQSRDWKVVLSIFTGMVLFLLLGAVKIVPDFFVEDWIIRVDPIDPLSNGGSLESNLASFIFGTSITKGYLIPGFAFGLHESIVLIGIIPVFFIIIGFIYGNKKWTIPIFFTLLVSLVWADGGKTLLSFIHMFPVVQSFRCPGRIFGPLIPLLLLIGVKGFTLSLEKLRKKEKFSLTGEQKRLVLLGVSALLVVKLAEVFFQEAITLESGLSIIFIISVIVLLYAEMMSPEIFFALLIFWLSVN
ncbi:MAG: hypothetical protein QUS12_00315, partial [Methanosarcina sp.]|nr:hypothetical protein [Methanosarcina sp.]